MKQLFFKYIEKLLRFFARILVRTIFSYKLWYFIGSCLGQIVGLMMLWSALVLCIFAVYVLSCLCAGGYIL